MGSNTKEFGCGVLDILPLAVSAAVFGAIYGMTSRQFGFPLWALVGMCMFIFAGSSQFMAANVMHSGAGPLSAIMTIGVVNLRMLLLSTALNERVKSDFSISNRLVGAFFVTDESFATFYSALEEGPPSKARYVGSAVTMYTLWLIACVAGFRFGSFLPAKMASLLSFAFPATFAAMVAPQIKSKASLVAALTAAIVAALCYFYIPGKVYIIAGCMTGSLAGVLVKTGGASQ